MKFKKASVISLILPVLIAVFLAVRTYRESPQLFWKEYSILLLMIFAFWAATTFAGLILAWIIKNDRFSLFSALIPQGILIIVFVLEVINYNKRTVTIDINENVKQNHLMIDYDKTMDDSLAAFPDHIRIGFKKLEQQFADPNAFRIRFFGSEGTDSLTQHRTIYFSYITSDSLELYSKLEVAGDSATLKLFNMPVTDTGFRNARIRLTNWANNHIKTIK